jgi:hypothetical protein
MAANISINAPAIPKINITPPMICVQSLKVAASLPLNLELSKKFLHSKDLGLRGFYRKHESFQWSDTQPATAC